MPIVTTTPIEIDLGEYCKIEKLVVGNRNIWICGGLVVFPVEPFSVVGEVPSEALYRYDLSALFSSLLRFNGGFMMRWRKKKK